MKLTVTDKKYGVVEYDESLWTGKKTLTINGKVLHRLKKKVYHYNDGEFSFCATLKGNLLFGINLNINGDVLEMSECLEWYVFAIAVFTIVFNIHCNNFIEIIIPLPLVGGALGGGIAGWFSGMGLLLSATQSKPLKKILISLAFFVLSIFTRILFVIPLVLL